MTLGQGAVDFANVEWVSLLCQVWSSETQKEITIVPGNRDIYHAIYWDWDYKIVVMNKVTL